MKVLYIVFSLFLSFHFNAEQAFSQSSESDQIILLELFSSTTCPGCAQSDSRIRTWLSEHPQRDKIHIIKYPMWGPGNGCLFYHENPVPVMDRVSYYGSVTRVPTVFVNGIDRGITIANWFETADTILDTEPTVKLTVSTITNHLEIEFDVMIETTNGEPLPANAILRSAVVESDIEYQAPNGTKIQDHVHRAMYPDATGIQLESDTTIRVRFTGTLKDSWNKENLKVIFFVQQDDDKKLILGTGVAAL